MTNEDGADADSLKELGTYFSAGYIGNTMCNAIDTLRVEIDDRLRSITKLLPYLSGMYFSDRQRQMAEREIFRLQTEISKLHDEMVNTLVMAPDLGRPVTINHT